MRYHVITLFPSSFDSYLNESILKRAIADKKISVDFYNPRDFGPAGEKSKGYKSDGKKLSKGATLSYSDRRVDDKPYGGGPGMVIEALPVIYAIESAIAKIKKYSKANQKVKTIAKAKSSAKTKAGSKPKVKIIFFSPSGVQFDQGVAKVQAKKYTDIIFVCGRYEGIDARIKKAFKMEDISVGPFVLTGGELPAMILIDAISRHVPGVLGHIESLEESRVASPDVYTRPEAIIFKGKKYKVPAVLLSGNHKLIEEWRAGRINNSAK